ncbi:MAG: hypothetical protein J0I32_09560 [Sphingobacteriales bacterium]|nr:hypothetical protein [Sphingobacteriales bacterium]OJW00246.1 MAG: hypothetical protein BGO52_03935 [Sphingobacteriales bacterium 44-61]
MRREYFDMLHTIDRLISIKGTGNPKKLASKIGISERSLYDILNVMKELGAPIKYSKEKETYYYEHNGNFNLYFQNK